MMKTYECALEQHFNGSRLSIQASSPQEAAIKYITYTDIDNLREVIMMKCGESTYRVRISAEVSDES